MQHQDRRQTDRLGAGCSLATVVALACLATFLPQQAQGQVASDYRIPLTDYLNAHDLNPSELGGVVSLNAPADMQWTNGITGNVRQAYFTLNPVSRGQERINRSVRITYNPIYVQPLVFESCSPDGDCQTLAVSSSGRSLVFSHEGTLWEVRSPGSPCKDTYTCSFSVPAWSLEMRRQGGVNGWKSFPATATLLDQPRGLSIFDARTGKEWASFPFKSFHGPTANLGAFKEASLSDSGTLNLTYQRASLLLDFATDRIFVVTAANVYVANESLGLGQDQSLDLTWQELQFVSGTGKVIVANSDLIIWEDRAAAWNARASHVAKISGTPVDLPGSPVYGETRRTLIGTSVDLLTKADNRVTHYRFEPLLRKFDEISTETFAANQNYGLSGGVLKAQTASECEAALKPLCADGARVTDAGLYSTASVRVGSEIRVSILRR